MDTGRTVTEEYDIEERFKRTDTLTRRKLLEYIPIMILTNMSVFVLSTVDSLVAGNLVGSDALASVQIFMPAVLAISVFSVLVSSGTGTSLSTCIGKNDVEAIRRTKNAVRTTMFAAAAIVAVAQLPIIYIFMDSYNLNSEIRNMAWQYAAGMMIAMPIGLISSVGSYQLTILGKMRVLMIMSLGESIINLIADLFFVELMHLGVAGIGYGTACANLFRCSATLIYLLKNTDLLRSNHSGAHWKEIKDILRCGMPDAAASMMVAAQNYFMMRIILEGFGDSGGVIKGVCFLAYSITNILTLGIQGAMRPLIGLYAGSGDTEAMKLLMRRCLMVSVSSVGLIAVLMGAFPEFIYRLNGVKVIPEGGILSMKYYLISFIFLGMDALFRLYFANRKDSRFATSLTLIGNATLPVFALVLYRVMTPPHIWLAYLMTELSIFFMNVLRYRWWRKKDRINRNPSESVLFLSVKHEDAIEASRSIRRFADAHGYPQRVSYRMSLCMEEMVAYAVESQKNPDIQIQITARFSGNEGKFMMLDDGVCIALDENETTKTLITDNYELLKKVAKSVEYQYILNMNYTVITF